MSAYAISIDSCFFYMKTQPELGYAPLRERGMPPAAIAWSALRELEMIPLTTPEAQGVFIL